MLADKRGTKKRSIEGSVVCLVDRETTRKWVHIAVGFYDLGIVIMGRILILYCNLNFIQFCGVLSLSFSPKSIRSPSSRKAI